MVKASKAIGLQVARYSPFSLPSSNQKSPRPSSYACLPLQPKDNFESEKDELKYLYRKLNDVIPSCRSKPTSSVDIVLSAVDYIRELHRQLENISSNDAPKRPPLATVMNNTAEVSL